ncbi:hypothetical protein [Mucilaginibacter antarcticus]|uniref:hypothetical protein n=1 Tax=Mucilaginibacter antarcticus TaxID=1855725 RepID=UPI0036256715
MWANSRVDCRGWAVFFISMCYKNASLENGMIYGYTAMLVGFSLIFVGIKNYRDNYLGVASALVPRLKWV